MRRGKRLPLQTLQPYLLDANFERSEPSRQPLDWKRVFGNDQPVEIEVGFGKGLFLVTASQARPDVNFLGIEIERAYQLFTATRLAKRQIANVRLICGDARLLFRHGIADRSVDAVHAYFPDPWWKQRHRKRRLFTDDFVAQVTRVLPRGGKLIVATDVGAYFAEIEAMIQRRPALVPLAAAPPQHYLTNFERKFRQAGKPIYRGEWEAKSAEPHQSAEPRP